jgi:hypothetical protein
MEPNDLAITKLIILSIVRRIPAITLNQLTAIALDTLYMDYFGFASAFDDLGRDQMIAAAVRKDETVKDASGHQVIRCDITQRGLAVLETLENRIPLPIRSYLAQEGAAWQKDIRRQRQLTAQAEPDADGHYQVRLRQTEGTRALVDLSLSIPDKTLARQICEQWQRQPQGMYLGLLALLTGDPALKAAERPVAQPAVPPREPARTDDPAQRWQSPLPHEQSLI